MRDEEKNERRRNEGAKVGTHYRAASAGMSAVWQLRSAFAPPVTFGLAL